MSEREDIRGVLISVTEGRLLLPNASVAEVITFAEPEPLADAPHWLLGRVRWRGWRLPLVSFARMADLAADEREFGAKLVVIKALGANPRMPYFAVLSQGFPRLVTVTRQGLIGSGKGVNLPLGVQMRVMLNDEVAMVPDLASIELLLGEALAKAA